ncbi:MAG: Tfp pilus assembly protein FimT/FimU [Luteimonas sp.]
MHRRIAASAGFTLIELMVTLGVLAIVLVAAAPSFADFLDRYRLRGAVDDVVSLISDARAASVKTDRDVNLSFGGASTTAWCLGANAAVDPAGGNPASAAVACDCTDASQCLVGGERMAIAVGQEGQVAVDSLATAINFNSKLGLKTNPMNPSVATFTSPRGTYDLQLTVNVLGQASVCTPSDRPAISGILAC